MSNVMLNNVESIHGWAMTVALIISKITSFVDSFIHPSLLGDRDRVNQARVFLISHLFGPILGSAVPAALYVFDPTPGFEVAVLTASILGFWLFPPLLRSTGRYNLLAVASVQNLIFCILWSCYFYGGIKSPTIPWVLTIPLLAFFYVGTSVQMRIVVCTLFLVNILIFVGIAMVAPPVSSDMAASAMEGLGIVSIVAVALYVTMMALYYAKVYASQSELESEMRLHLATASELRQATDEAERAGAAKAEFLAKMSHELRTPLNAVIGYSQMLMEDAQSENDAESLSDLRKIHSAGHHLLKLINEVLDLSKIDAGMMELYVEDVSISGLVRQTANSFLEAAKANGNVIDVDVKLDRDEARLDHHKLSQVLSHLLDNAAKFTSKGLISVSVRMVPAGTLGEILEIAVKDTGIGIAEGEMPTLFEHFTVLGDASSSKYGGTGLGLALSRKLCRIMGGDLLAASKPGVGSTFRVQVPIARQETDEVQAPSAPPVSPHPLRVALGIGMKTAA